MANNNGDVSGRYMLEAVDLDAPAWVSPLSDRLRITGCVTDVAQYCDGECGEREAGDLKSEGSSELERMTCSASSSFLRVLAKISLTEKSSQDVLLCRCTGLRTKVVQRRLSSTLRDLDSSKVLVWSRFCDGRGLTVSLEIQGGDLVFCGGQVSGGRDLQCPRSEERTLNRLPLPMLSAR